MKKNLLLFTIFIATYTQAQQEIKVDIAKALILKTVELSYENYFADQTSFGTSVFYNFEDKKEDFSYNEQFMLTPYIRHYFTTGENWNYFGEVFFAYNTGNREIELNGASNTYKKYSDGALGIAGGSKYISSGGLVIDIYIGLGRNLFSADSYPIVPRAGLNVGWRF